MLNIKKINNKLKVKKYSILLIAIFCFVSLIIFLKPVAAETTLGTVGSGTVGAAVATLIGWITSILSYIVGLILTLLIKILVNVAQFNNIINVEAVTQGWIIVRDLCNMFFILILLVVAFATILRIESYQWKKILPKLLIMAVLINFSKTICGLIIDFSQVIMLTFVNGFSDYGANNFVNLFNIQNYQSIKVIGVSGTGEISNFSVAGAFIAGLLAMIITTIVVLVMLAVLVMRVVMLWVYVILSPLAFLAAAFPAGQKYASQWWGEFSKNVIVGPVLAFFLWLALVTAQKSADTLGKFASVQDQNCAGVNAFFCEGNLQTYIITIGLLIGGLIVTQQMGGMAASIAGKGMDWAKKSPKLLGKGGLAVGGWGARKLKAATGYEIRPTKIISGIKEALVDKARREEIEGESKSAAALRRGGVGGIVKGLGASRDLTESVAHGFLWHKGLRDMGKTIKAGGLRNRIEAVQKQMDDPKAKEKDKKKYQVELDRLNQELSVTQTPYTYFADQKRNAAIKEQMGKIGDNDNEEDLVAMFNASVARGDKESAAAIYITASKVGHANEIIMSQKSTEDVFDDNGVKIIEKGKDLHQSGYGMSALTNQVLIKKLGMSEQEAYNIQSQVSTNAKSIGHFNLAESIGVKNGMLYQRKVTDQRRRSRGELRKVDVEKVVRNFNRLAYGDERNVVDEKGETKRKFKVNELGFSNILEYADTISKEIKNRRFQKNAAMNIASDIENLRKMVEMLPENERKFWDGSANNGQGGERNYLDVVEEIKQYGDSVKAGMDRAKEVEELASKTVANS